MHVLPLLLQPAPTCHCFFPAVSHARGALILIRISPHESTSRDGLFLIRIESALGLMRSKYEIVNALSMRIKAKCEKAYKGQTT